jgi:hypothetical protein
MHRVAYHIRALALLGFLQQVRVDTGGAWARAALSFYTAIGCQ